MARVRYVADVRDSFDGYTPHVERWTKPSRKRKPVISKYPIFPHVVIIHMGHYHESMRHRDVRGAVKFGRDLLLLRDEDIQTLNKIEIDHKIQRVDEAIVPKPEFKVGDRIQFITGCFAGFYGVIAGSNRDHSYEIDMDDAKLPITVDGCMIEFAGVYGDS